MCHWLDTMALHILSTERCADQCFIPVNHSCSLPIFVLFCLWRFRSKARHLIWYDSCLFLAFHWHPTHPFLKRVALLIKMIRFYICDLGGESGWDDVHRKRFKDVVGNIPILWNRLKENQYISLWNTHTHTRTASYSIEKCPGDFKGLSFPLPICLYVVYLEILFSQPHMNKK